MKFVLILVILSLLAGRSISQEVNVIPYPAHVKITQGEFVVDKNIILRYEPVLENEAIFLKGVLATYGIHVELFEGKRGRNGIILKLNEAISNEEGYTLNIQPAKVEISGKSAVGVFYGIQTWAQLLESNAGRAVKCCEIEDAPRFPWRGFMLDEARHFFGKQKVIQLLSLLAYYKINKFHWHLTDEQGWRIEIKKYPLLATIGGQGNWSDPEDENARYYTQEEIRGIVAYAASLHIEIIPEIDMPGHATAANKAYPEYSGGGTPEHPEFTFNVGKEAVYTFLSDILKEVAGMFSSPYMHIGGDEVAYGIKAWETNHDVQELMKREGLIHVKDAERYFIHRMSDTVKAMGKTLLGWDELLDAEPDTASTLILWWRHDKPVNLKRSLDKGYKTVLCPRRPLYYDFIQHEGHKWGRTWNGFNPMEDVYMFPDKNMSQWKMPEEGNELIMGVQANLWTERVQHEKRLDFMIYPRICALAEAAWTQPGQKSYSDFTRRMENNYPLFDRLGIYYFDPRDPERHPEPEGAVKAKKEVPMDYRD